MIGIARSRRGAGIELLDLATRWPLYLVSASEPLVVLLVMVGEPQARFGPAGLLVLLVVLSVLHTVGCLLLLRAGLARFLGGPRPPVSLIVLVVALTGAGVGTSAVLAGVDGYGGPRLGPSAGILALVFCIGLTGALAPLLTAARLFGLVVAGTVAAGGAEAVVASAARPVWAVNYLLVVGTAAFSYRFSIWFLGLAWELNRSREVQARLAVAEERLRFARDLHDVLGRNLALIAVNSQLAAELARRGQGGAIERMLEVHRTAQDSMREVREVVTGARTADLGAELTGARSVLRSAGISVRVIGDGTGLPPTAQVALGWVVREATTNIIRHSDPATVRIELAVSSEPAGETVVGLRIENDGAPGPGGAGPGPGTGLIGLRERLVTLGGQLQAGPEPEGRFVVLARLPLTGSLSPVSADRIPE